MRREGALNKARREDGGSIGDAMVGFASAYGDERTTKAEQRVKELEMREKELEFIKSENAMKKRLEIATGLQSLCQICM